MTKKKVLAKIRTSFGLYYIDEEHFENYTYRISISLSPMTAYLSIGPDDCDDPTEYVFFNFEQIYNGDQELSDAFDNACEELQDDIKEYFINAYIDDAEDVSDIITEAELEGLDKDEQYEVTDMKSLERTDQLKMDAEEMAEGIIEEVRTIFV